MAKYAYFNASSVEEALDLLAKHKDTARIVCGSTDTMVRLHLGRCPDCTFINIRAIESLKYIREEDGYICIGAGTNLDTLAHSELLMEKAPALFMAANDFADPTIRHSATVGGNLGNASPSADTAPSLLSFDADVVIAKQGSTRTVPARSFFTGVGKTVLESDELILEVRFLPHPNSAFVKVGLRSAMAISVVNIAAAVQLTNDGVIEDVRIGVGAVAPTPVRALGAEAALKGNRPDACSIQAAMDAIQNDIRPITDVRASEEYRRIVTANMMRRVVLKACGICEEEGGSDR